MEALLDNNLLLMLLLLHAVCISLFSFIFWDPKLPIYSQRTSL